MTRIISIVLVLFFFGCKDTSFRDEWTREKAPEKFTASFETTKGTFEIEVTRSLSPKAADRFYQLVRHNYFKNGIFYRVVPDFVAQFGNTDTQQLNQWRKIKIPDEPVKLSNAKGTVSFARSGKETRDAELFINLKDNPVLDTLNFENVKGFPAFGMVSKGMDVVTQLYGGYAEITMTDQNLYQNRDIFYRNFPKLDLIKNAHIIE